MRFSYSISWVVFVGLTVIWSSYFQRCALGNDDPHTHLSATAVAQSPSPNPAFDNIETVAVQLSARADKPVANSEEKVTGGPTYSWYSDVKYKTSESGDFQEAPSGDYSVSITPQTSASAQLAFVGKTPAWWQVTVGVTVSYSGTNTDTNDSVTWDNSQKPSTAVISTFVTGEWEYSTPDPSVNLPNPVYDWDYTDYEIEIVDYVIWSTTINCHPGSTNAQLSGGPVNGGGWPSYFTFYASHDTLSSDSNGTDPLSSKSDSKKSQLGRKLVWCPQNSKAVDTNLDWEVDADIEMTFAVNANLYDSSDYTASVGSTKGEGSVVVNATVGNSTSVGGSFDVGKTYGGDSDWTWSIGASIPKSIGVTLNQPAKTDYSVASQTVPVKWPLVGSGDSSDPAVAVTATCHSDTQISWSNDPVGPESGQAQASVKGGTSGVTVTLDPQIPRKGGQ